MKTTEQILLEAAVLVERGWCKGANARDKNGKQVSPTDPAACAWCMVGAVFKACGPIDYEPPLRFVDESIGLREEFEDSVQLDSIEGINDYEIRDGADAAAILRSAAALAKGGGE